MTFVNRKGPCKLVLILLVSLFFSGCWDRRELDTLAIVVGVGIDLTEDEESVVLTAQVVRPESVGSSRSGSSTSQGGGGTAVWVTHSIGRSVAEAVAKFTSQASREMYWSHNQVIVIGQDAARKGVIPLLDYFVRNPQNRRQVWVLVTEGNASEVIKASTGLGSIPAVEISRLVQSRATTFQAAAVNLQDFLTRLVSPTTAPISSWVSLVKEIEQEVISLTGSAVFKQDKLVGRYDQTETRGVLWVLERVEGGIVNVKCPGEEDEWIGLEISNSTSKIEPQWKDGKVTFKVAIDVGAELGNQHCRQDIVTPTGFSSLERRLATEVSGEIDKALRKSQEFGIDVFGFGDTVHIAYPKLWKELEGHWDQLFADAEVEVTVQANVNSSGGIVRPIQPE